MVVMVDHGGPIEHLRDQQEETLSADLVVLARRYLELCEQLEQTRNAMRAALANGAAGPTFPQLEESAPRPTAPPRRGREKPQSPLMQSQQQSAAEGEAAIVAFLKSYPGAKTAEIVTATGAKRSTAMARLRRLRSQGKVSGGGEAGWSAAAP
jgi:hypothetical protein